MVAASKITYTAQAYNTSLGKSSGSATTVSASYMALPGLLKWLGDVNELSDSVALVTAMYEFVGVPLDGKEWSSILRSRSIHNETIQAEATNSVSDFVGVQAHAAQASTALADACKALLPGQDALIPDPRFDWSGIEYVPAYPNGDFNEALRQIAASLGMPVLDVVTHLLLMPEFSMLHSAPIADFQVNYASGPEYRSSVGVQWYDTKLHTSDDAFLIYKEDTVINVESGETQEFTVDALGTVDEIFQPVIVGAIPIVNGTYDPSQIPVLKSIYCVTGSDGYLVSPARWNDNGGWIRVERGTGPFELKVTVHAADDPGIGPFTITEGADRPALYITGRHGVSFNRQIVRVSLPTTQGAPWGSDDFVPDALNPEGEVDAPFVDTLERAWSAANRLAASYYTPQATCSGVFISADLHVTDSFDTQQAVSGTSIPLLPSCKFYKEHSMWRITGVTWDYASNSVRFEGEAATACEDFNNNYQHLVVHNGTFHIDWSKTSMSCAEFNNLFAGIDCRRFDILPLMHRAEELL